MKVRLTPSSFLLAALSIVAPAIPLNAQHIHLNAGAASQTPGTPLFFQNGATYATDAGYIVPLRYATNGTYAGYYEFPSFTPTGIGTGLPGAAAAGTQIRMRFVSVTGPTGGSIGVWDVPGFNESEDDSTALTFSLLSGTTNGTQSILLSENNGEPGADPFGHIHGRHFTATQPGLYTVTVQAYDNSSNGSGGGPIHTPSALLSIYFQAGVTIASVAKDDSNTTVTFGAALGSTYYVQSSTNLSNGTSWQNVAGPIAGDNHLRVVPVPNGSERARFIRLRQTTP